MVSRWETANALLVALFEGCMYLIGHAVANTYGLNSGLALIIVTNFLVSLRLNQRISSRIRTRLTKGRF